MIPRNPIVVFVYFRGQIDENWFAPVLQILVRGFDVARLAPKATEEENFLAIFGDHGPARAGPAAAQATIPAPTPVDQVGACVVAKGILIALVHVAEVVLALPVDKDIGIGRIISVKIAF